MYDNWLELDEPFPYLEFFDKYQYSNDYDMLMGKMVGCSIFDNYLLKSPVKDFCICYSKRFNEKCICHWACQKLLKDRNKETFFWNEVKELKKKRKLEEKNLISPLIKDFREYSKNYNKNFNKNIKEIDNKNYGFDRCSICNKLAYGRPKNKSFVCLKCDSLDYEKDDVKTLFINKSARINKENIEDKNNPYAWLGYVKPEDLFKSIKK